MGYLHIQNLYKAQEILTFKECYALEKIHGTSSHITFDRDQNQFYWHGGGIPSEQFKGLFNVDSLEKAIRELPHDKLTIYGESYGGKMQKNQWRYGPTLKFIAFDVKIADNWLTVPDACEFVQNLEIEFVHYVRIETKLSLVDAERDAISEQAIRNGVTTRDGEFIRREGVVLRPITEDLNKRGNRVMAKHKRDEERETKTPRKVVDLSKAELIIGARAVAEEFVVPERLNHVLSKIPGEVIDMTRTKEVISAMIEDVNREGAGEFEPSNTVNAEIGKRTAQLLKQYLDEKMRNN